MKSIVIDVLANTYKKDGSVLEPDGGEYNEKIKIDYETDEQLVSIWNGLVKYLRGIKC